MINLKDFIEVLADKDDLRFFLNDEPIMYVNDKLKDSVLSFDYGELMSFMCDLENPLVADISVKRVSFDADEYGGERGVYLVVEDKNLKELQQLSEKRAMKIAQINAQMDELKRQLNKLMWPE